MKMTKIFVVVLALIVISGICTTALFAETRSLTSVMVITIKAPAVQQIEAPKGLEETYSTALVNTQNKRLIKVEAPTDTQSGLARHTFTEIL